MTATFTAKERKSRRAFPPRYNRIGDDFIFDDFGHGSGNVRRGGGAQALPALQPWQLPPPKVLRGVLVGGRIQMRWVTLFR